MENQTPTDHLFKFVSVRPVQHVTEEERRVLFIEQDNMGSELVAELDRASSLTSRQTIADGYIRSSNYVPGFIARERWIGALREVLKTLEAVKTNAEIERAKARMQRIVSADEELANKQKRATIGIQVWNSLFSAYLSPRTDPRDRAELIALVRALYAIEKGDALQTVREVVRVLKAEPLIPGHWFETGSVSPSPSPSPSPTPNPTHRRGAGFASSDQKIDGRQHSPTTLL